MPIHYELSEQIATVTIDRTERRNALNLDSLNEVDASIRRAVDEGARAIVITGADGHFCAGADLSELEDVTFTERLAEVLEHLASVPVTTVAAIPGACMGLGMQLAVGCDLRVATADARFAVPVAKLGLMVNYWTLDRVTRFFGEGAARQMVLCGEVLTADDAWRLGFIQKQGGLDVARALAAKAVPLAPLSQAGSKIGFDHQPHAEDISRYEAAFQRAWASEDLAEGQAAFGQRRTPEFHGR
ncbi:MAG: enoyl-CoA hydratase-related protein [Micrococcales bacterium]|nr:enoyl-CoA hydratase-related protein [Micrococcales bacterium]